MAAVAFAAFLVNLLVLPRTAFGRSLRREGEPRWNGLVAYPLAVALGYVLFPPHFAALAWAVMALGDPAATIAGRSREWKARIPWNRRKSVAGSAVFVLAATVGFMGVLYALRALEGAGWKGPHEPPDGLALAAGAAFLGALVEAIPWPADDNLPILLAVGGAMALHVPAF